jgi:5-methylcytosine-specific restriction protein A
MPLKPARPCKVPTCPCLTRDPSGYCDEHADHRQDYDRHRGSAVERGYDRAWHDRRNRYMRVHPLCEWCKRPATLVDHIIPKRDGGTDKSDNLQSLCNRCHAQKTRGKRAEHSVGGLE